MNYTRLLAKELLTKILDDQKVVVLYGPRQVGKTTLVTRLIEEFSGTVLSINADDQYYSEILSSRDTRKLGLLVNGIDLLFIDEAQRIEDIGINLKILHDQFKDLRIIVTGSSSLDLASKIKEPLTGRTWTYKLYPISLKEVTSVLPAIEVDRRLEEFLRFGMYPNVLTRPTEKQKKELLIEISESYLYKDILEIAEIKYPRKIRDLLRLMAFQTGSLVSFHELGKQLEMSTETVQRYVDLLQKSFVIFELPGFSRNLRKEITKSRKFYFYDVGIRNAVLNIFSPPARRHDKGELWENFLIAERQKHLHYERQFANTYFWRTYGGAEIDYIEDAEGQLDAYEIKWKTTKGKAPNSWKEAYPGATFTLLNNNNYHEFVGLI